MFLRQWFCAQTWVRKFFVSKHGRAVRFIGRERFLHNWCSNKFIFYISEKIGFAPNGNFILHLNKRLK